MVNKAAMMRLLTLTKNPFRKSLSLSLSTPPFYDKVGPLKGLVKQIQPLRDSIRNLNVRKCYPNYFTARSKFAWGNVLGASVIVGFICHKPRVSYALNGFDILEDGRHLGLSNASSVDEYRRSLLTITRKILLPFLLFITILMNLDHPAILAVKVILILVGTKPSPLSIYISIEQLRCRYMREEPILFRFKSLYAKKVEVDDYAFMCLGRVELKDQKFTLVGILGNWWVFPTLSPQGSVAVFKEKVLHYIRNSVGKSEMTEKQIRL